MGYVRRVYHPNIFFMIDFTVERRENTKCQVKQNIEKLEAMRLKDIEGLNQKDCAESMHVSRKTFQNIIDCTRKKVAVAHAVGNSIRIGGGNYRAT